MAKSNMTRDVNTGESKSAKRTLRKQGARTEAAQKVSWTRGRAPRYQIKAVSPSDETPLPHPIASFTL